MREAQPIAHARKCQTHFKQVHLTKIAAPEKRHSKMCPVNKRQMLLHKHVHENRIPRKHDRKNRTLRKKKVLATETEILCLAEQSAFGYRQTQINSTTKSNLLIQRYQTMHRHHWKTTKTLCSLVRLTRCRAVCAVPPRMSNMSSAAFSWPG